MMELTQAKLFKLDFVIQGSQAPARVSQSHALGSCAMLHDPAKDEAEAIVACVLALFPLVLLKDGKRPAIWQQACVLRDRLSAALIGEGQVASCYREDTPRCCMFVVWQLACSRFGRASAHGEPSRLSRTATRKKLEQRGKAPKTGWLSKGREIHAAL